MQKDAFVVLDGQMIALLFVVLEKVMDSSWGYNLSCFIYYKGYMHACKKYGLRGRCI